MADMNNADAERWQPTGGTDANLDEMLNRGTHEGRPIYIHLTSAESYQQICDEQKISKTPNQDRRGAKAKMSIYLNPSFQRYTPEEAHMLLFLGNEKYRNSSTHMFVFAFKDQEVVEEYKVTHGSPVKEIIYRNDVKFGDNGNAVLLHSGANIFVHGNSTRS